MKILRPGANPPAGGKEGLQPAPTRGGSSPCGKLLMGQPFTPAGWDWLTSGLFWLSPIPDEGQNSLANHFSVNLEHVADLFKRFAENELQVAVLDSTLYYRAP